MTVDLHIVRGLFSGSLLSTLLFGVLTIQTSSYYRAFPNDGRAVKLVVGFLCVVEAFQLVCSTQSLYRWVITNYYNPAALKHATWEFTIFQISAVCASVTVQTFFAHRVYSLSANLHLGVLVEVLVLVQFGFGVATGVIVNKVLNIGVVLSGYGWVTVSWLVIQATADIVIATCMCLVLQRQRTGFQKTNSMIDRMILYTISTGLITSVLSCIILGMFLKYGLNVSVLIISLPLSGLYSVTMLANLHTRKTLQARLNTPGHFELISSSMKMRIRRKAGNCGNEESLYQRTRINSATEVGSYDVDMNTDVSSEQ
ncbi:hypothetical protein BS47DRAFT_1386147 [Hydnum rufescens UP504]|uniref:DUF6534 domain-containing protein n=1 Tax=Hydnum rufescens UP504 TaxID=1448309 RepID=A0A9P6AFU2_9AGAM|nr:hypothetical protein BS47DRAFT_1386147 [Hydnum rufescens UP504]